MTAAPYTTTRQVHVGLAVVVKHFPRGDGGVHGGADLAFVLVHGVGVSSRYFEPLAARLARRGPVHVLDLPGFGAAPRPRRRMALADHAAVLASFLQQAGLVDPVVVGHSWGAQVVSLTVRDHPDLTDRVVLMSPTLSPGSRTFWRAFGNLLRDALRESPVVFGIAFVDYIIRSGPPYVLRHVPSMLADRIEDRIGLLRARILVITGDRDPLVDSTWARELAARARRSEFREVHGPHVIMHTEPEMIARCILEFADPTDGDATGADSTDGDSTDGEGDVG